MHEKRLVLTRVKIFTEFLFHFPDLNVADSAFHDSNSETGPGRKPIQLLDKELRAAVLRLMVRILEGYRSCLTIVRIHPVPYITFHKAAFLGMRSPNESDFIKRLTNSMFFNALISERGPPWRHCDVFDELYSVFGEQSQTELADPTRDQYYKLFVINDGSY